MLLRGREGIDRLLKEEKCAVMCWSVFLTDDLLIDLYTVQVGT